jgi:hypothetical protein
VERKRVGESANSSAARAPLSPASARSLSRALREETSAVSDMAKRPLKRVRITMTAICNATPSIRGSCTRGTRFPNKSYSPNLLEEGFCELCLEMSSAKFACTGFSEVRQESCKDHSFGGYAYPDRRHMLRMLLAKGRREA